MKALALFLAGILAMPALAQPVVEGPLVGIDPDTPLRVQAERCGGVVILAISQATTPGLQDALRALTFTAMGEGGRSEDVQAAMIAWAGAYAAPEAAPRTSRFFAEDRAFCLALAAR
ncbi:MAG: hypothetical protein AAGE03_05360 [Pseudomonadota bacterium]